MKAIVAHAYSAPEGLTLEDWPTRAPAAGEVQVRLHSAGIAFVDVLIAAGKHQIKPPLPFIPGNEFSGEIIAIGAGVSGLAPGDSVCGGKVGGILAQVITLPAARVQKLPPAVSMDHASVLRGNYLASWYSLVDCGRINAGETVLVLGAGGGVGVASCQIAKYFGATVIASASTDVKRRLAMESGADHALDSGADDWRDQLKALTVTNGGVDIVVDPVGGLATEPAFRSLAYKGRHLMVGFASGAIPSLPTNLAVVKGASLIGVSATYFNDREPESAEAERAQILELFRTGILKPAIGKVFALENYVAAMQAAVSGEVVGRIVLRMH